MNGLAGRCKRYIADLGEAKLRQQVGSRRGVAAAGRHRFRQGGAPLAPMDLAGRAERAPQRFQVAEMVVEQRHHVVVHSFPRNPMFSCGNPDSLATGTG